jgi:hypothetical protein
LVKIRKQLKSDGWDYGPRSTYYEATLQDGFPGGQLPSVATIARLLASVGQVNAAPRKRPKSSYVPFVRATAMSLWQLDALEYRLSNGQTITIYQLIDDATRYDVGTWAYLRHENSTDAKHVLVSRRYLAVEPRLVAVHEAMRLTVHEVKRFSVHEVMRLHTRSPEHRYHQLFSNEDGSTCALRGSNAITPPKAKPAAKRVDADAALARRELHLP